MRNLTLSAVSVVEIENASISATAIDIDENVLYAASESRNPDRDVNIELWKVFIGSKELGKSDVHAGPFAMFTAAVAATTKETSQVISLKILPEFKSINVISRAGDITLLSLENELPVAEVEGTFESGILAASWSPDDMLLALITGDEKLVLMTSTFDVLSEAFIDTTQFGEDAPINVGWGSKETQFHGSLGKAAAQAHAQANKIGSSPDDDQLLRISWRGDAQYFVISKLSSPAPDGLRKRVLRVYDRQGALQSTSEDVGGLEHTLSWRPSGNLIAGTQRFGFEGGGAGNRDRHDVVFFERNGLRHGQFGIRVKDLALGDITQDIKRQWGYRVCDILWNAESTILALWIEKEKADVVQLWTTGNYHWYLKQEIASSESGRFTSVNWHPENPNQLILTTNFAVILRTYEWETCASQSQPPVDSGSVAVFDGSSILLTPFRTQNVPPPMSSHQLSLNPDLSIVSVAYSSRIPVHASFSNEDYLGILWECGYIEYWNLRTRLGPGAEKIMDPVKIWSGIVDDHIHNWRQLLVRSQEGNPIIVVLGTSQQVDVIAAIKVDNDNTIVRKQHQLPLACSRLICMYPAVVVQDQSGKIVEIDPQTLEETSLKAGFPEYCLQVQLVFNESQERFIIGLGPSGKLYAISADYMPKPLAPNATSFTIASGFIIYTTSAHDSWYVPLKNLPAILSADEGEFKHMSATWETRKVERGSRIIVAVPSSMSLVLQMPRGNLETINPRPLVMEVVKQDLDTGGYRKAFLSCRKHRIDLTVIVDHNQKGFFENVGSFVEQVHEVDYINLFLTAVGRGSLPVETIARVCDAIRKELERISLTKYINSILTAYVVKTPSDHESALACLLKLRNEHSDIVEDAVKYTIFLADASLLFDTALGMYDFSLVLMIAQHSQKDPREYLPFLRELRALEKYYQQFRIDDHLKRREKALKNLGLAGPEHFEEAVKYIESHQLYESALSVWKNTERYNTVLELYGDWLFDRREYKAAALVFVEAQKLSKAMIAHERALEWRELFTVASLLKLAEEEIVKIAYRVAEELCLKKRHLEAGQVFLEYAQDVRHAVMAIADGNGFSEARRIVMMQEYPELVTEILHPAALETKTKIMEDLKEMREQLSKQVNRLRELRIRKAEEPNAFYGTEDPALHNVDIMTDVSMAGTNFTRYTVAASDLSKTSKRSSRSKRKLERKVGSGRRGTVDEEEYLLKSMAKLVGRFHTTRDETSSLLPHLFQFTEEHREEGRALQMELSEFENEISESLNEVWANTSSEETEGRKAIDVPKPELQRGSGWRIKLFDL